MVRNSLSDNLFCNLSNWLLKNQKAYLILLMSIAFIVRVSFCLYSGDKLMDPLEDQLIYERLASNILAGDGLTIKSRVIPEDLKKQPLDLIRLKYPRFDKGLGKALGQYADQQAILGLFKPGQPCSVYEPLYPLIIAGLYKIFGYHPFAVKLLQTLVSTLGCLIIYQIGKRIAWSGLKIYTASLAALLYSFYPYFIYYCAILAVETFYLVGLLFCVWLAVELFHQPSYKSASLLGLFLGFTFLQRSSIFIYLPWFAGFTFFYLLFNKKYNEASFSKKFWFSFTKAILIPVFFFVAVSPWLIRNYKVHGEFLLLPTKAGLNLWMQNNPEIIEEELIQAGFSLPKEARNGSLKKTDLLQFPTFTNEKEVQRDRILKRRAFQFISANPSYFAKLCWIRLRWFLSITGTTQKNFFLNFLAWMTSGWILPVSLLGFVLGIYKRSGLVFFITGIIILTIMAHTILHGGIRYRIPTDPYFILLSSLFISAIIGKIFEKKWKNCIQN